MRLAAPLVVAASLLLPPLAAAQNQGRLFTPEEALGGGFGRIGTVSSAQVSWIDGKTYLRASASGRVAIDARTGKESAPFTPLSPGPDASTRFGRRGISPASPDGKLRASIVGNDIHVADESGKTFKLTSDGSATTLNGILDWVYDEEVYGRGSRFSYRWSPDSKKILFLKLDTSAVKPYTLSDQLLRLPDSETYGYPLPGDPNPIAKLALVEAVEGAQPALLDTSMYPDDDRLIVRFWFSPDGSKVLYEVQNREQNILDLWSADARTGSDAKKLIHEEAKAGWIEPIEPRWLESGKEFLWESERSGYKHIYRYDLEGKLLATVTKGEWDVKNVVRLDEKSGNIFVDANSGSVMGSQLWRARLDGKSNPACLTPEVGTHRATLSPSGEFFLDSVTSATAPGMTLVRDAKNGKVLRVASENRIADTAKEFALGIPKVFRFKARDGYPLEGTLLLPPGWTPGNRVAVLCPVYSGPDAPTARDSWSSVNGSVSDQFYAQRGIAVWKCDNRSANPRGTAARWCIYKNMGGPELRDIEDGLDFLIKEGIADPARIGISGWSYGGYMTAYALTHSKKFAAGVAGASPTDWRLYDTIYTERYMSTPQKNPAGYDASSCIKAAGNLSGRLMLVHGMMDDNVHVGNTIQLVHALQKAGKDFELCLYPGKSSRHGLGDRDLSRHQRRRAQEFLLSALAREK
jgi:dipeptidyl-peptidase-4